VLGSGGSNHSKSLCVLMFFTLATYQPPSCHQGFLSSSLRISKRVPLTVLMSNNKDIDAPGRGNFWVFPSHSFPWKGWSNSRSPPMILMMTQCCPTHWLNSDSMRRPRRLPNRLQRALRGKSGLIDVGASCSMSTPYTTLGLMPKLWWIPSHRLPN
jgi:hypothetical protein